MLSLLFAQVPSIPQAAEPFVMTVDKGFSWAISSLVVYLLAKYVPRAIESHIATTNAVGANTVKLIDLNAKQTDACERLARNGEAIASQFSQTNKSQDAVIAALQDPDHPHSALRTEEAMLQLCGIIDLYAAKESDDEVKHAIATLNRKMREILTRKIGSRV